MALDETGGEGVLGDVWGEYEVVQEEETQKKGKVSPYQMCILGEHRMT